MEAIFIEVRRYAAFVCTDRRPALAQNGEKMQWSHTDDAWLEDTGNHESKTLNKGFRVQASVDLSV